MGTTADKLNKLKATKEAIRTAINNKGGTLTTSDKFSDYATAIDNIQSGGGGGGGSVNLLKPILTEGKAPVPNTGYVEKIFFNTKLTTDEVDSLIANANLPFTRGGGEAPMYFILGAETGTGLILAIIDFSKTIDEKGSSWAIANPFSQTFFYTSSSVAADFGMQEAGWNAPSFTSFDTGEVTVNGNLVDTINDIDFGTANNLLTNLIYLPELVDSGETEVVKSLTDQYKLVEKNIELDAGTNNNYTYDFINNINEDTKEINIIRDIKIKNIERNIIEKDLITYTNNDVTKIGSYVFYRCGMLTDVSFPKVTEISDYAFAKCGLVNINMPLVTTIKHHAFYDCIGLVDVSFPELTTVENNAFASCSNLQSITAPALTKISNAMFHWCESLTTVDFPNVTEVGTDAFMSNYRLTEIILPKLNYCYTSSFLNCYSLVKLFITQKDKICTMNGSDPFVNCLHILGKVQSDYNPNGLKDGYIYVPASLLSQYKVATNWSICASQIIGHEDLEAGASLPNYTTDSFTTQTWYSDEKLTNIVTEVTTAGTYYCRLEA